MQEGAFTICRLYSANDIQMICATICRLDSANNIQMIRAIIISQPQIRD